ncbi:MAG TPA: glycoside hydrolase family 15 protein, partial [Actinomycetota bacterium]|nr:glycoside hydrolase family 15 protein [Actinomycetota bacterium]
MDATAIEDYALIGDTRTAALVSREGSIDWMCAPRFDSEPVFGSLVGGAAAGRFAVTPRDLVSTRRRYRDRTATLETRWETAGGAAELVDAMVLDVSSRLLPQALLVRELRGLSGSVEVDVFFDPRPGFGAHDVGIRSRGGGTLVSWGASAIWLGSAEGPLPVGSSVRVRLDAGKRFVFALAMVDRAPIVYVGAQTALEEVAASERWWKAWSSRIDYEGPHRDAVERSAVTLRLLTYAPSGAPVAAPTTSLPELIGGSRNWDYRFAWPRDASLGTSAFLGLGLAEEAEAFLHWLVIASRLSRPRVDVLYDVLGRPVHGEDERDDLPGYRDSRPVRLRNAACDQHQLDVYGWVVESAWQLHRRGRRLEPNAWRAVQHWADFAAKGWASADAGIWERRDDPAHHVHSKAMAWQAIDRAVRLAEEYDVPLRRRATWMAEAARLRERLLSDGLDEQRGVFVDRFGGDAFDAALLMLPSIGFDDADSPRLAATVDAIRTELDAGGGLLYRYPPGTDGLEGGEGAFVACTLW